MTDSFYGKSRAKPTLYEKLPPTDATGASIVADANVCSQAFMAVAHAYVLQAATNREEAEVRIDALVARTRQYADCLFVVRNAHARGLPPYTDVFESVFKAHSRAQAGDTAAWNKIRDEAWNHK